jgi:hypothetical protein
VFEFEGNRSEHLWKKFIWINQSHQFKKNTQGRVKEHANEQAKWLIQSMVGVTWSGSKIQKMSVSSSAVASLVLVRIVMISLLISQVLARGRPR